MLKQIKSTLKKFNDKLFYNKYIKPMGIPYSDYYAYTNRKLIGKNDRETTLKGKTVYRVDTMNYVWCLFPIFCDGVYDFETKSEKPIIIDCGANVGVSVIYFKLKYPNAKIIAFEPDNKIYNICKKNIESFEFSDTEVIEAAVWDAEGVQYFAGQSALSGHIVDESTQSKIEVKTIRLRSYLESFEKIDFLKIDIEGAEHEVLKDCKDSLKRVENLFVEYHAPSDKEQELDVLLKIIKDAGFRYYIKEDVPIMIEPYLNHKDVIANRTFDVQLAIFAYRL